MMGTGSLGISWRGVGGVGLVGSREGGAESHPCPTRGVPQVPQVPPGVLISAGPESLRVQHFTSVWILSP